MLHEFEDFISCKEQRNYAEASTIQLSVQPESTAAPYLLDGFYVSIDDWHYIIRDRIADTNRVSVIGYSPFWLLKQRVANEQTVSGSVDSMAKTLITSNTQGNRSLPITCASAKADGTQHTWTTERNRVNYEIEDMLKLDDSGVKTKFIGDGFEFDTYHGADRSAENTEGNEPVIFAVKYDNLLSFSHETGNVDTVNVVYIENNEGNVMEYNPNNVVGVDRFETTGKLSTDEDGNTADIKDSGAAAIVKPRNAITSTIAPYTFVYGADYFLGDIVTIEHKSMEAVKNGDEYDIAEITRRHAVRITSMAIDYTADTVTYTPTFGTVQRDLRTVIKKQQKDIISNQTAIKAINKRISALEAAI